MDQHETVRLLILSKLFFISIFIRSREIYENLLVTLFVEVYNSTVVLLLEFQLDLVIDLVSTKIKTTTKKNFFLLKKKKQNG